MAPPARYGSRRAGLPWVLVVAAVLLQVAYPLLSGESLRVVTIGAVVVFAAASVVHAAWSRGLSYAGLLVLVAGAGGLAVEAIGTRTGLPFGGYAYADSLGPRLVGVPVVVPLAWVMMAHPCGLAGRVVAERYLGAGRLGWLPAAWLLAAWDVFLDPQMVAAGHWTWAAPTPALPAVPGVPLGNYLGWLVVAAAMMLALVPAGGPPRSWAVDAPATVLLLWTYAAQVLANLAFFGRPAVAAWGGVLMGVVVVPYATAAWPERPRR